MVSRGDTILARRKCIGKRHFIFDVLSFDVKVSQIELVYALHTIEPKLKFNSAKLSSCFSAR